MKTEYWTKEKFDAVCKVLHVLVQAEYHCNRLLTDREDKEKHMSDLVLCRQDLNRAYDELATVLSEEKENDN